MTGRQARLRRLMRHRRNKHGVGVEFEKLYDVTRDLVSTQEFGSGSLPREHDRRCRTLDETKRRS